MSENIFENPHIIRTYYRLSMPLVFSMAVGMIYNLADTYYVAATGDTNIVAGVSLCAPLFTFLMAIGNIYGQGGSSLISRLLGQNAPEDIRRVSAHCFYASLLVGAVIGALLLLVREPGLVILGASDETMAHASEYYTWFAIGSPLVVASFVHTNLLRAEGFSVHPTIASVGGALVNIVLDPIFISTLGMGAAGAAIASVIGYIFTVVYCLIVVICKSRYMSVSIRAVRIPAQQVQQVLSVGIAAALANVMSSICTILINQQLLPYGNDKIAAMGIAVKVSMIVLLILTGFAYGGLPQFGYYYGARDTVRLRTLLMFCVRFLSALAIVLSSAVFVAAPTLIRMFLDNDLVVGDGTLMLRLQVVTMVCVGLILLFTLIFQSAGMALTSLILSISRQGVVFIIVILIASRAFGYYGVLFSQAVSDVITLVFASILFYRQYYRPLFG